MTRSHPAYAAYLGLMGCHAPATTGESSLLHGGFTASEGKLHLADLTHETD